MSATALAVQHPEPEGDRAVVIASPTDPRVEYITTAEARLRPCRCPSAGVILGLGLEDGADDGFVGWRIKILHAVGCEMRTGAPVLERRPASVYPCPDCGNVVFSLVPPEWRLPGWRRCDGPRGCGRGFQPRPVALPAAGEEG